MLMGSKLGRIVRGALTLGTSELLYQPGVEQKKAQERAANAQAKAEMDARRIASEAKPLEESATLSMADGGTPLDALGLMTELDPTAKKKRTGLGSSATTGLGSSSLSTSLGFGG